MFSEGSKITYLSAPQPPSVGPHVPQPAGLMLISAADCQRLLYFNPPFSKRGATLTSPTQTGTACDCPCRLSLHKGVGFKGRSCLPTAGEIKWPLSFQVPTSAPARSPGGLTFRVRLCRAPPETGGQIPAGPNRLLGGRTGVDLSFQKGIFAYISLSPSEVLCLWLLLGSSVTQAPRNKTEAPVKQRQ